MRGPAVPAWFRGCRALVRAGGNGRGAPRCDCPRRPSAGTDNKNKFSVPQSHLPRNPPGSGNAGFFCVLNRVSPIVKKREMEIML